ncbi:DNA polymerase III subunit chi [Niveibacterium terrae]|uniref:DNA polymerase III subunit chi n=1 Tax=Niveibacterium terrae TaxID=3373598 RepID=UPI003A95D38B
MTEIRFFHNAADKLSAACRIIATAYRKGRSVTVYAPAPEIAARIDALLWDSPYHPFLPHVAANSPLAGETPVLIDPTLDAPLHLDVLVSLADAPPPGFERFAQLIEIVTHDPADAQAARTRWRQYARQGYKIESNDLVQSETA